jgi:hypothetical protein
MRKLTKKEKRKLELGIIIAIALFSILIWDTVIIYPVKLFVVLIHEFSHGIAAFLSGGKIVSIEVNSNIGGRITTEGGLPLFIAMSGYMGSLLLGAVLFLSAYHKSYSVWIPTIIAALLIWICANYIRNTGGIIIALSFAAMFITAPRILSGKTNSYLLKSLGIISSIYILIDLKDDIFSSRFAESDAYILESLSGIPSSVWGFVWIIITLVTIFLLLRFSYRKGLS